MHTFLADRFRFGRRVRLRGISVPYKQHHTRNDRNGNPASIPRRRFCWLVLGRRRRVWCGFCARSRRWCRTRRGCAHSGLLAFRRRLGGFLLSMGLSFKKWFLLSFFRWDTLSGCNTMLRFFLWNQGLDNLWCMQIVKLVSLLCHCPIVHMHPLPYFTSTCAVARSHVRPMLLT